MHVNVFLVMKSSEICHIHVHPFLSLGAGYPQFVPPEGYEGAGGGGISPLTPPFIMGPPAHLAEGMEMPPEFVPALALPIDSRVC